ncbi:nucleotide disphospho-sugar-binding domain-containing protein [Streptomyces sp. EN27]|uniref:nucleotide disphospho-sugar-binding domain-containing protein n=1 Tax=Streptomyces sp. EN27 TaxID=211464 RepID=UPI0008517C26|nr:nucleotide disphospho-sugar-binding domain-containing protein [Streptomyces sp. EN27]
MRILLTVPSSRARLHRLAPLGWALRTAGHQVQVAGRPSFTDSITLTGLVAVPVGDGGADDGGQADHRLDRRSDTDALLDYFALWRPDLVVWDSLAPAGAEAAQARGVAAVRMLGPLADRSEGDGMPGRTLDCLPPSLRSAGEPEDLAVRFIPYGGSAVLPAWLRRKPRRRRVHATLGGSASDATVTALFEAMGGSDAEFLCELADDRIPAGTRLPGNVRLFEDAPRDAVLASCEAAVHDGGAEMTMSAVAAGLPQLILTDGTTPTGLAPRVADEGGAILADPAGLRIGTIGRLLDDPEPRAGAARLRDEVAAMPGPREIVPLLAAVAGQR